MVVKVQTEDFDMGAEVRALHGNNAAVGAITTFVGTVRDMNNGDGVATMTLEHYPGMTEKSLESICVQAKARWDIADTLVIHRYGRLEPLDQIVLVAVTSAHRAEAFSACEFIMDFLKTQAPFWKKEATADGERWVNAKAGDDDAAARWSDA